MSSDNRGYVTSASGAHCAALTAWEPVVAERKSLSPKNEFVDDFPGEARRYMRRATGYDKVLVNGQVIYDAAGYTEARPGKVV